MIVMFGLTEHLLSPFEINTIVLLMSHFLTM